MMRLNLSRKRIMVLMFMLILFLTGCSITVHTVGTNNAQPTDETASKDGENMNSEYPYSISLVDTSWFGDLPWRDKLSFNVIRIREMPEDKLPLEDVINQNIKNAMTSWVRGKVINPTLDSVRLEITCHSGRYLSFKNSFVYVSAHEDFINDYVTIDMMTGQRVLLNDLVKINEDFTKFLLENPNIIKEPSDLEPWQSVPNLNKDYSLSELLEELSKCSFTQEELIENGDDPIEESSVPLIGRTSFFLRDGMLVISLWRGGEGLISLDVEDIKDFLKVDQW